jgi:hypothetical protein
MARQAFDHDFGDDEKQQPTEKSVEAAIAESKNDAQRVTVTPRAAEPE